MKIRFSLALVLCGLAASCVSRDPPSLKSKDPDALVPAIKIAVAKGDKHAIPYLVTDLESDDSAVRLYAIDGLRRLTGLDMGYVYYADDDARKPAVERWKEWLKENPQ